MTPDNQGWRQIVESRQLSALNELKGIAIILVIAYHTQLAVGWINWSQGHVGVDIFLVISGWLIGRSLSAETTLRDFCRRRVWRIVPAYWLALGALCLFKYATARATFDWTNVAAHFAGVQIFGPDEWFFGINPSFWFISLLLLTYPLAFCLRAERSPARILCVGMTLGILTFWGGALWGHHAFTTNVPARLVSFCFGLAISAALRANADFRKDRGLFFALLALCGYFEMGGISILRPTIYAFALMALYLAARGGLSNEQARPIPHGALAFLGVISYEIFLLHQPLLRLGFHILPLDQLKWGCEISALLGIIISIALGWILHRFIAAFFRQRKVPATEPLTPSQ
jgi:peptidoglycan/LPS O-acetylase OafA/YrhL